MGRKGRNPNIRKIELKYLGAKAEVRIWSGKACNNRILFVFTVYSKEGGFRFCFKYFIPKLFNVDHGVEDSLLVDFPDGGDLLVLGVGTHGVDPLQKLDVVVPNLVAVDVHSHLLQREIVGLGHLLPRKEKKRRKE